ncbi:hypothetical protein HY024_00615 [Candidatus Curtissbacteria bacterium]|nr:hypothetical protein [Candidatus Curtissbacteria bacterium]
MRRILQYKYHFLIFIFSFFLLSKFSVDPDLGWHMAIGEHFLRTGEVIKADTFSWTMPGYMWGNSYFVYQIIVAILINYLGLMTTGLLFGLLGAFGVVLMMPRRLNLLTFLVVCLGVVIARSNLAIRPHMISFFMFSLMLVLLKKGFYLSFKSFVFWILFFLTWANFHNGFLIGLGFFGLFVAIEKLTNYKRDKRGLRRFLILAALLFMATLVTPFGLRLWQSVIGDAFYLNMYFSIAEWLSIVFFFPENVIFLVSALIFIFFWFVNFKKVPVAWMLLSAMFFTLPFLGVYFDFFWAAAFIFMVANFFPIKAKFEGDLMALFPVYIGITAAFLVAGLSFYLSVVTGSTLTAAFVEGGYPAGAVAFMEKNGPYKNIYNDYAWGGFIDWQYPEQKVFMDGRMTGWRNAGGGYIFRDYLEIAKGNDCSLLDKYGVRSALVRNVSDWSCDSKFKEVYRDKLSRVLVRD